jgi:hypothetical protein
MAGGHGIRPQAQRLFLLPTHPTGPSCGFFLSPHGGLLPAPERITRPDLSALGFSGVRWTRAADWDNPRPRKTGNQSG